LRSMTFDSPSKLRFLYSVPSPFCSSIDIPDSVEILQSSVGACSGGHFIATFGCKSRLRILQLCPIPMCREWPQGYRFRAFVRLSESTMKGFRSDLFLPSDSPRIAEE
jgi:hypothetical protein